jgi:hypothetical protein
MPTSRRDRQQCLLISHEFLKLRPACGRSWYLCSRESRRWCAPKMVSPVHRLLLPLLFAGEAPFV